MSTTNTVIEIRPFKDGWRCYEGPGVQPDWTGDTAKQDAFGYASAQNSDAAKSACSITLARRWSA